MFWTIQVALFTLFLQEMVIKGSQSGLGQFVAPESPLKMKKSVFSFPLNALFVLKILKFLFWLFGQVKKWLD